MHQLIWNLNRPLLPWESSCRQCYQFVSLHFAHCLPWDGFSKSPKKKGKSCKHSFSEDCNWKTHAQRPANLVGSGAQKRKNRRKGRRTRVSSQRHFHFFLLPPHIFRIYIPFFMPIRQFFVHTPLPRVSPQLHLGRIWAFMTRDAFPACTVQGRYSG